MTVLLALLMLQIGADSDRLIGLLELPEIFGNQPCEIYPSSPIVVHALASGESARIATIEVARPWKRSPASECEAIEIAVKRQSGDEKLPIWEIDYEVPAAIVFERSGSWFRIQLENGTGWILPRDTARFSSYPDLLSDKLTYIQKGWDGRFALTAGAASTTRVPNAWLRYLNDNVTAELLETRRVDGGVWFHFRLDPAFGCDQYPKTLPKVEGWLPAYRSSRQPSLWFYSHGC